MSTRQERQRQKAILKKAVQKISGPILRKLLESEIKRGAGTEIYRLDDDGTGQPLYFNISAMKEWASKHSEIFSFPPDVNRARRLIESGAVEPGYIQNYTLHTQMTPIIVCRDLLNEDQIVDGAHRFVAACMGAEMMQIDTPFIPGYLLHPEEWRPFIIPRSTAEAYADYR